MSREQPDALALLDIARESLLEQVLPHLDGNARYQALMIANAMAMAVRELTQETLNGTSHLVPEAQLLRSLYDPPQPSGDEAAEPTLARLERRFARDLRDGELDGDQQRLVRQLLRAHIETRLAVSNPRRMAREAKARVDAQRSRQAQDGNDCGPQESSGCASDCAPAAATRNVPD